MPRQLFLDGTSAPRPAEMWERMGVALYAEANRAHTNLTGLLEREDPTSDYADGDPLKTMDAFERMAMAAGCRFNGGDGWQASTLADFDGTPQQRAILPEFMARAWRDAVGHTSDTPRGKAFRGTLLQSNDFVAGTTMLPFAERTAFDVDPAANPIPLARVVARVEQVRGQAWHQTYMVDSVEDDAYAMRLISEGAEIPATKIVTGEREGRLFKIGRRIDATYESLRRLPFDRIARIVGRIALRSERDKIKEVFNTALNGDGNANTSARVVAVTALDASITPPGMTYLAYLAALAEFGDDYQPNAIFGTKADILNLKMVPVGSTNGLLPLGALGTIGNFGSLESMVDEADRMLWRQTTLVPANKLLFMDTGRAIVHFEEIGSTLSETARFIRDQHETLVLSEVIGFAVEDQAASLVVNKAA